MGSLRLRHYPAAVRNYGHGSPTIRRGACSCPSEGQNAPRTSCPFLENVTSGEASRASGSRRSAQHYMLFGGKSPINELNLELLEAMRKDFADHGLDLPIYWGNRNWDPYLRDAARQMEADGVTHAACFVTSAYSSYSGCRQYREDLFDATNGLDVELSRLRHYFNHPGFVGPLTEATRGRPRASPGLARHLRDALDPGLDERRQRRTGDEGVRAPAPAGCRARRRRRRCRATGRWPTARGPAHRTCRGSSPTSTTTFVICTPTGVEVGRRRADRLRVRPHGGHLSTSTPRRWRPPRSSAWRSSASTPPAPTPTSWRWSATWCSSGRPSSAASRCERLTVGDLGPSHDRCPADCCFNARADHPTIA